MNNLPIETYESVVQQRDALEKKLADVVAENTKIVGWIFEDELPKNYPYDAMCPHSKVDVVRMFPVFAPSSAQPVIPEHSGDNLPCPFCGGDVDVSGWRSSNGNSGPECNECGATASNLSDWNKRAAQPVSEPYKLHQGWIKGQFAYQDLFNAIGAAVVSKHPSIEISVKAFEASMLAAAPAQESE